jgi:polar amino acid transport system substrate-binding protein
MERIFRTGGLAIAVCIAWTGNATAGRAEDLSLYTLDAPPMTMIEAPVGEHAHGFVADIVVEAARRAGYQTEFRFLPWKRGQEEAAATENALITPLARTPEREAAYTWIAPIYPLERAFATLDRPVDSFADARTRLNTILVGRGSAQEATLHGMGFDDGRLIHAEIGVSDVDMLRFGRVDAWFNSTIETEWKWRRSGQAAPLVFGRVLYTDLIYLACAKRCAPDLVRRLRVALKTVDDDGTARAIQRRYLGST